MQRKIILQNKSYTLTLPKDWILKNQLKAGDELIINEQGTNLTLTSTNPQIKEKEISFNIEGTGIIGLKRILHGAYKNGFDIIELNFKNSKILHEQTNTKKELLPILSNLLNRFIGFDIVKIAKNKITIRDFAKTHIIELSNLLRRIFLLIKEYGTFIDSELIKENIQQHHDTITKYINYCMRTITKCNKITANNKTIYFSLLSGLDKVTDFYRHLFIELIQEKKPIEKEVKALNELFDSFYQFHYSKNKDMTSICNTWYQKREIIKNKQNQTKRLIMTTELLIDLIELSYFLSENNSL